MFDFTEFSKAVVPYMLYALVVVYALILVRRLVLRRAAGKVVWHQLEQILRMPVETADDASHIMNVCWPVVRFFLPYMNQSSVDVVRTRLSFTMHKACNICIKELENEQDMQDDLLKKNSPEKSRTRRLGNYKGIQDEIDELEKVKEYFVPSRVMGSTSRMSPSTT